MQNFLKSKILTVLLVLCLSAVGYITVKLYMQKSEVDSEIDKLSRKADELNRSNQELSELVKYFNTPEYKEREAREKLNLKKPGEEVVVLPKESESKVLNASVEQKSNPQKWIDYFFNNAR